MSRPTASVIVPFAGPQAQLAEMLRRLAALRIRAGDELLLVDNRREPQPTAAPPGVRLLLAAEISSSWYARNRGVAETTGDWLVFIDADTRPVGDLLDRYFDTPPADDVGILAGGVRDWLTLDTRCARYVTARAKMDQIHTLANPYRPYAQTANCAVRRTTFDAVGGFPSLAMSAGDADLCWRALAAGWRLEPRLDAYVDHENRTRLADLFRQLARHGAGLEWLEERYPGSSPRPRVRELFGRVPHYLRAAVATRGSEESAFALLDLACLYARDIGRLRG